MQELASRPESTADVDLECVSDTSQAKLMAVCGVPPRQGVYRAQHMRDRSTRTDTKVGQRTAPSSPARGEATAPAPAPAVLLPRMTAWLLWPCIVALPLWLASMGAHRRLFPASWWLDNAYFAGCPSPLGLLLGLASVAFGMFFVILYHWARVRGALGGAPTPVQRALPSPYSREA